MRKLSLKITLPLVTLMLTPGAFSLNNSDLGPRNEANCQSLKFDGGNYMKKGPFQYEKGIQKNGFQTIVPSKLKSSDCKHSVIILGTGKKAHSKELKDHYEFFASYGYVVVLDSNQNKQESNASNSALNFVYNSELAPYLSNKAGIYGYSKTGLTKGEANLKAMSVYKSGDVKELNLDSLGKNNKLITLKGSKRLDKNSVNILRAGFTSWFRCNLDQDKNACDMFDTAAPSQNQKLVSSEELNLSKASLTNDLSVKPLSSLTIKAEKKLINSKKTKAYISNFMNVIQNWEK